MKAVVKYHNDLNTFSFNEFTEKEWDLFFAICYKIKDKGTDVVEFDFSELKELLDLKKKPERLREYILSLNEKLLSMKFTYHIELDIYDSFVFFSRLQTNFKTGKLEITINFPVKYLLNDLMKNYTKFDLMDFVSLKSTYSKKLFKLLKQWETVKEKKFLIEEFRYELGVPQSYKMSDIDKRVFKIIMEELPKHFINLKLEKIKTGKTITSLKFTWSRKVEKIDPQKNDGVIDIIEISEKLNQAIEKAKKNRFIEKLLTIDNIEILTQMFQENDLI
ncbi:MAG: replication initiation protein, partial [Cetobacterium sp.]